MVESIPNILPLSFEGYFKGSPFPVGLGRIDAREAYRFRANEWANRVDIREIPAEPEIRVKPVVAAPSHLKSTASFPTATTAEIRDPSDRDCQEMRALVDRTARP